MCRYKDSTCKLLCFGEVGCYLTSMKSFSGGNDINFLSIMDFSTHFSNLGFIKAILYITRNLNYMCNYCIFRPRVLQLIIFCFSDVETYKNFFTNFFTVDYFINNNPIYATVFRRYLTIS